LKRPFLFPVVRQIDLDNDIHYQHPTAWSAQALNQLPPGSRVLGHRTPGLAIPTATFQPSGEQGRA